MITLVFTIYAVGYMRRYAFEKNEHCCFILLTTDNISPKFRTKILSLSECFFAENDNW